MARRLLRLTFIRNFFGMRQKRRSLIVKSNREVPAKSWADLPQDLLSLIAVRLGLIDLLSFRGTCKDWRSASSTASAQIESMPKGNTWFILHGKNSECILYNEEDKKLINIPELDGTTCLASNQGWLLLFKQGSMFFFCPFSRAKVDLPQFPHPEISDHVAAFSSPPTSKDCIVSIINRYDQNTLELHVLCRRDDTWTRHDFESRRFSNITGAIYGQDGAFYYMDSENLVLTFHLADETLKLYRVVDKGSPVSKLLPFYFRRDHLKKSCMRKWLDQLDENVSVSTCGTLLPGDDTRTDTAIHKENINNASNESESRQLRGIWIQPRFHQIPPNQSWSL